MSELILSPATLPLHIAVQQEDFSVADELNCLSRGDAIGEGIGAVASFVGYVRGASDGVAALTLEHYPGMTEKTLREICLQAHQRWPLAGARVIHRIGRLLPGEQIVLVAVASRHRGNAFAACEFIMDWLKTRAPFWKQEETAEGRRWVDARESDELAAARWGDFPGGPI